MWEDFRKFAFKGNIVDLGVAVILGAAFGKIVTSLVNDLIMPLIGLIIGGVNFTKLSITVGHATVKYGIFIQSVVDFLLVALSLFLFMRFFLRFRKKEEKAAAPAVNKQEELLAEIRDLLKTNNNMSER
jgi:large conductance mechanosensitive channel